MQAWGFAGEPYALSLDTVSVLGVNGQATDLSSVLEKSLEQVYDHKNLQGVIVFSDGGHNLGQDPVRMIEEHGVPLYLGSIILQQLIEAKARGLGNKDITAILLPLEELLNIKIRL